MFVQTLQFLSKAHRCEVQAGGWEKEPALFKEVINRALNMGEGKSTNQLCTHLPSTRKHRNLGVVLFQGSCMHDPLIPYD